MSAAEEIIDGEIIEEASMLPAVRAHEAMVTRAEVSVDDVVAQRDKVKAVMDAVMEEGVHYGRIPGVDKPSLWKPGAELLNVTFRLAPSYPPADRERIFHDDGHLTVISKCRLTHIDGIFLGEGEGLCTSYEDKYAFRNAKRVCPSCGAEAVIKGKAEYGGGWLCWKKNDGCGAKFPDGDQAIESQAVGKVPNENVADTWNTIIKMANKRALVAATLNCTAASDIFTQDLEDMAAAPTPEQPAQPEPAAKEKKKDKAQQMRSRILELISQADEKRGSELTLDEVEHAFSKEYQTSLADANTEQLEALGKELGAWVKSGTSEPFTFIPF